MRKIVLLFCTVVLLSFCACDDNNVRNNVSTPLETITENETQKGTEMPTENITQSSEELSTENTVATLPSETAPTQSPTEEKKTVNPDDYVSVMREEHYQFTDSVGNDYNVTMKMPKLNDINGVSFENVNNQITNDCKPYFDENDTALQTGTSLITAGMTYEDYATENLISISVTVNSFWGGVKTFYIYNVDASTGNLMNNEELAEQSGMTYSELREKIRQSLEKDYNERYPQESYSHYEENSARTLSDENIDSAKVFFNSSGQLMAVCAEYTEVGAEVYYQTIALL